MNKKQLNLFFYWMNERHSIYMLKSLGEPWPWTKDKILQEYKFTNVFRQNDAVTKQLTKRLKECSKLNFCTLKDVFARIVIFRMFNWPYTYDLLKSKELVANWNTAKAIRVLTKFKEDGNKVFTGAYIITNNGRKEPKIELMCSAIGEILRNKESIVIDILAERSIEHAVKCLIEYPMVGKFIAYELATDLRHTKILGKAEDIYEWANPGPGAKRGLNRLHERPLKFTQPDSEFIEEMRAILSLSYLEIDPFDDHETKLPVIYHDKMILEMRDIEHSLCEFDKYMRVKNGEGRPRSKYRRPV